MKLKFPNLKKIQDQFNESDVLTSLTATILSLNRIELVFPFHFSPQSDLMSIPCKKYNKFLGRTMHAYRVYLEPVGACPIG